MQIASRNAEPRVGAFVGGVMSQLETLMVFALGSALTLVVVLLFGRFFWGLAVAAAAKRKARMAPVEVLDAQAERDKLRAEHALMSRKLDLRLEDIKVRMAEQMAEVSRNRNRVQGLVEEIERKDESLRRKEQENVNLAAQVDLHRAELSNAHKTIEALNTDAERHEDELSHLQNAFHKITSSMRDKQQALQEISGDLHNVAAPTPYDMTMRTEIALRNRVAQITAISMDMKEVSEVPQFQSPPLNSETFESNHSQAFSARLEEAQRLSDDMERELKSLDSLFTPEDQQPEPSLRNRKRTGGNVISLAQRIRALQKGMGE